MDKDNDPSLPKIPEIGSRSPSEKAVTETPSTVSVSPAEKPKDRLINKPGAEMMQTVIPERTLRIGDPSAAVTRSLTQDLGRTSARSKINKLLGEPNYNRQVAPTTIDKTTSATDTAANYDAVVDRLLSNAHNNDKVARTAAAATLGMYQFQRTTSLAYMSKNLSNALKHTAVAIDTYALTRAGFTMMERKLNAIIVNTAAPDAVKRTIYDIVKEALVRQATVAASDWVVDKYRTTLGPAVSKYVTNPARKKAEEYINDETTLGGKTKKRLLDYKTQSINTLKDKAGISNDDPMTSDALWRYVNSTLNKGKESALDYAKRRGVAGTIADTITGRPIQGAVMRGSNRLIERFNDSKGKFDKQKALGGLSQSANALYEKSGLGNITQDDILNALLGTDIRNYGVLGALSTEGDILSPGMSQAMRRKKTRERLKARAAKRKRDDRTGKTETTDITNDVSEGSLQSLMDSITTHTKDASDIITDPKKRRRLRRTTTVKVGRIAKNLRSNKDDDDSDDAKKTDDLTVSALTGQLTKLRQRFDDTTDELSSKLVKAMSSYDSPELKEIIQTIKSDPKSLRDPEVIRRVIETIKATNGNTRAVQALESLVDRANSIKDNASDRIRSMYGHIDKNQKPPTIDNDNITTTGDIGIPAAANDNAGDTNTDPTNADTSYLRRMRDTKDHLVDTLTSKVDTLREQSREMFTKLNSDKRFKSVGSSILKGMSDAFTTTKNTLNAGDGPGKNTNKMSENTDTWLEKIYTAINTHGSMHTDLLNRINDTIPTIGSGGGGEYRARKSVVDRIADASLWSIGKAGRLGMTAGSLGLKSLKLPFRAGAGAANMLFKKRGGDGSGDGWSIAGTTLRGAGAAAKYGIDKSVDVGKFGLGKASDIYGNMIRGAGSAVGGIASGLGTIGGKLLDPRQIGNVISAAGTLGKLGLNATGMVGKAVGWGADKAIGAAKWVGGKVFRAVKRTLGIRDNSDADMTHGVSRRLDDIIDLIMPVSKYFKHKYKEEYPGAGSWKDLLEKNKERLSKLKERVMNSKAGKGAIGSLAGLTSLFKSDKNNSDDDDGTDKSEGGIIDTLAGSAAGAAVMSRVQKFKDMARNGLRGVGNLLGKGARSIGKMGKFGKLATLAAAGAGAYGMMGSGSAEAATPPDNTQIPTAINDNSNITPISGGQYVQPSGNNPLVSGLGTGAIVAGSNAASKLFTKNAAKTAGKSLLKKIPGVGLAIGAGLAASRIAKGDYIGGLGEFASGALSTIPVYGTAASMGVDIWLATRDDPLLELNVYKALGLRQLDVNDDITNALYKLVETPVTGGSVDYNQNMVNFISVAFKFPQDKDVQRFVSSWYNTLAKPVAETLRKFASQFGKVNNYDPESYTTRIGRTIFQDMEKDDKTNESLTGIMKTFEKNANASNDPIIKLIMTQGFSVSTYNKWKELEKKNNAIVSSLAAGMSTFATTETSDKTTSGGTTTTTTGGNSAASITSLGSTATDNTAASGGIMSSISNWVSDTASSVAGAAKVGYESAKAYTADVYDAAKATVTGQEMSAGNRFSSAPAPAWSGLGSLSQQFESSKDTKKGSAMVGYDSTGGTSYGRYQIAAKSGTFKEFMAYLKSEGGENGKRIATMLESAGNAETGSSTGAVPSMWQKIANSDMGLSDLEHKFIMKTHYEEQFKKLPKDMQDIVSKSRTMQDVLASTSVQHRNYAPGIFIKSFPKDGDIATWITNIYNERKTRFKSSTPEVRASVQKRFDKEAPLALAMLKEDQAAQAKQQQNSTIAGSAAPGQSGGEGASAPVAGDGITNGASPALTAGPTGASTALAPATLSPSNAAAGISTGSSIGVPTGDLASAISSPSQSKPSDTTTSTAQPTINVAPPEMPTEELNTLNTTNEQQLAQLVLLNTNLTKMLGALPTSGAPGQAAVPNGSAASGTKDSVLYTAPKPITYATNTSSISLAKRG